MKVAAVVILYNPNEEVVRNIQSYLLYVEKVFVLDNSEKPKRELINNIVSLDKTIYFSDGENKGIAVRLNQALALATTEKFEWLLTMDQDSYFNDTDIINYLQCIYDYNNRNEVSMFGIAYEEKNVTEKTCMPVEVVELITSGSIINLSVLNITGGFDEALFIDEVDLEYCYNSITKGFKVIKFQNIFLNHTLGKISHHKSFKNLRITPRTLHSPIRVYYMIRNFLYVNAKYKNNFTESKKSRKKALLNRIKNNILYGEKKGLVMKFIFKAIFDYKKMRMGKIDTLKSG